MRHFAIRLIVALLTFVVGVTISSMLDFKSVKTTERAPATGSILLADPEQSAQPQGALSCGSHLRAISVPVLNDKALKMPQPAYPPIAKAARTQGKVVVQVVVDEDGDVISASAVSGHPLLQQAAVVAARQAKFSPTLLSGQPVKVSGWLTYNFVLE
ncbi:MAG: hypothetical protein DMF67_01135 [Acidobacteria bacterium]|nr:MAG: hypothetical protein DMF66_03495 [Acidobacteriota bacterium]PYS85299.1 MAG: hypothetical protein DMF67_01135 [Acidobacteriota bacterium]